MGMRVCSACGRAKRDDSYRPPSTKCAPCRRKSAARHRREYYAKLSPDKRHTLTQRRRAKAYGVDHVEYSRMAILRRWGYRCGYCGARAEHLDHIHPLSRGGADVESNMIPACAGCNLSKGAKSLLDWCLTFPGVAALAPSSNDDAHDE